MAQRSVGRMTSENAPSRDDWKNMNDMLEKKRAQNRIAQRNYRRNVKRRIEELEQQVATQARLLALEGETTKIWQTGTSSFGSGEGVANMHNDTHRPVRERQKDAYTPLPTPVSDQFTLRGDCSTPDTLSVALSDYQQREHDERHRENTMPETQAQSAGIKLRRVDSVSQSKIQPDECLGPMETSYISEEARSPKDMSGQMQFPDLRMEQIDGMHLLRASEDAFSFSDNHFQRHYSTSNWSDFNHSSHSPGSMNEDMRSETEESPCEVTLEGRIEYLIKCAHRAGFQDIDSAMIAFYTAKFDEGSGCSIAQRLSRKRCLPKLLEELRNNAGSWRTWEVHAYQDEILKSAESLLLTEMRSTLDLGSVDKVLSAFESVDRDGNWSAVSHQLQDEVPNLWSLLTALFLKGNEQPQFRHQARLVTAIISLLRAANNCPLNEISQKVDQILTK